MPTAKQKLLQDGKDLTLGILYLLDNAPDPPEEMEWHEYSDWAIAEHLKQHSYYYHPKNKRTLATAAKMRSRLLEMCSLNTKTPIQHRHHGYKDKAAFVFAEGGTDLFRKSFLERQGYNKETFSESRLSKHVSQKEAPADAKPDGRPEDAASEERNGSHASKSNSNDVGDEERREDEADAAATRSIQPMLPSSSNHLGTPLPPPENSHTAPEARTSDEQPPPSRGEGRRLRSSVDPQPRVLSTNNGTSCVNEKVTATSSDRHSRSHSEPALGAKRKLMKDHGLRKRQCQTKDATHQDDSSDCRPRSSATKPAERRSKTPSTACATGNSDAPEGTVTSREVQPQPQLASLNIDQQDWNMTDLYSDIQKTTDAVLSSVGRIRNTPSPLQPQPSSPLKDLYARCWGPRWEEVRLRQINDHVFRTPEGMTSLLSAFLCDRILMRGRRLHEIVSNVMEVGGSLGEALLEELDVSDRGESNPTFLHILTVD